MKEKIKIVLEEGVEAPLYETVGIVGLDLRWNKLLKLYNGSKDLPIHILNHSLAKGYMMLRGQERALLGTGIFMELPEGTEFQIRPRSGITLKRGLLVSIGTIDHDYRGEIGIIIINTTNYLNKIELGEKIAQGVFNQIVEAEWEIVSKEELSETERGESGFGHTGTK